MRGIRVAQRGALPIRTLRCHLGTRGRRCAYPMASAIASASVLAGISHDCFWRDNVGTWVPSEEGEPMDSLYERIGGENAILAAATIFYDKVLSDPSVSHFFAGLDMDQQVRKQVAFMSWAFGG